MANNGNKNNNVIRIPTKRVINLALLGKKHVNVIALVITIVVAAALLGVFTKFAVIDRLVELSNARKEAEEIQRDLQAAYNTIATEYPDIEDRYAHYNYIEMTNDELLRVDRLKVIELIYGIMNEYSEVSVDKWSVQENTLKIEMTTYGSMSKVNSILFTRLTSADYVDDVIQDQIVTETGDNENDDKKDKDDDTDKVDDPDKVDGEVDEEKNDKITTKYTVYLKGGRETVR